MLRRLVAGGVRDGHELAILLLRGADPAELAPVRRGAGTFARWDTGALLALLPATGRGGAAVVADRVREATGALVGGAHWGGDLAEDLLDRAMRSLEADAQARA